MSNAGGYPTFKNIAVTGRMIDWFLNFADFFDGDESGVTYLAIINTARRDSGNYLTADVEWYENYYVVNEGNKRYKLDKGWTEYVQCTLPSGSSAVKKYAELDGTETNLRLAYFEYNERFKFPLTKRWTDLADSDAEPANEPVFPFLAQKEDKGTFPGFGLARELSFGLFGSWLYPLQRCLSFQPLRVKFIYPMPTRPLVGTGGTFTIEGLTIDNSYENNIERRFNRHFLNIKSIGTPRTFHYGGIVWPNPDGSELGAVGPNAIIFNRLECPITEVTHSIAVGSYAKYYAYDQETDIPEWNQRRIDYMVPFGVTYPPRFGHVFMWQEHVYGYSIQSGAYVDDLAWYDPTGNLHNDPNEELQGRNCRCWFPRRAIYLPKPVY